jgi:hypothetical protein
MTAGRVSGAARCRRGVRSMSNALDQHAAAGDVDFRKRMTGGYVASNCYPVRAAKNYF